MQPYKHQRRHFITTSKNDRNGDGLVEFINTLDQNTDNTDNKSVAIKSRLELYNGVLTVKFSKVGKTNQNDGSLKAFTTPSAFKDINNNDLVYTSNLTIDFNNKTYSINGYGGDVINNAPIKVFKDNLDKVDGNPIEDVSSNRFMVDVYENGVEKQVDVLSLFTEEMHIMFSTTSVRYHAINCMFLNFGDKKILRADNNTVWKINDDRTGYEEDITHSAQELLTGSHLNYNNITNKLWYSNGSRIYQIAGGVTTNENVTLYNNESGVTINYDSTKYVKINNPGSTLTITVNHTNSDVPPNVTKNVIIRIDTDGNTASNIKVVNGNPSLIRLINMYDTNINSSSSGINIANGQTMELVFTFWSGTDVTFNGGVSV